MLLASFAWKVAAAEPDFAGLAVFAPHCGSFVLFTEPEKAIVLDRRSMGVGKVSEARVDWGGAGGTIEFSGRFVLLLLLSRPHLR